MVEERRSASKNIISIACYLAVHQIHRTVDLQRISGTLDIDIADYVLSARREEVLRPGPAFH